MARPPAIRKAPISGKAANNEPPQAVRARLSVKVTTRASRNEIVGWMGDRLKLRIAAPPQDGRANEALEAFLAEQAGIPKRCVRVAVGHTSTSKVVEFDGMEQADLARRFSAPSRTIPY